MAIHSLCDRYVDDACAADPECPPISGVPGHDHEVTDFSPEGVDRRATLARENFDTVSCVAPTDDTDRVTQLAVAERIGLEVELQAAGELCADVNMLTYPVQRLRDAVESMPTETAEHWEVMAQRLLSDNGAVADYLAAPRDARKTPARLQVAALEQFEQAAGPMSGVFTGLVDVVRRESKPLSAALHDARLQARWGVGAMAWRLATDEAPGCSRILICAVSHY